MSRCAHRALKEAASCIGHAIRRVKTQVVGEASSRRFEATRKTSEINGTCDARVIENRFRLLCQALPPLEVVEKLAATQCVAPYGAQ